MLSGRKLPLRDGRLSSNRNHLEVFRFDAGRAVGGAIVLGPQLLEVAAQPLGLPSGVERGERPVRRAVVGAEVLHHFGRGKG